MARFRFLRGSALDPFAWTAERRAERQLIRDYEALLREAMRTVDVPRRAQAAQLLALPQRNYGRVGKPSLP
ncbi:hypothetical protein G3T16_14965 [Kineobactrum salinum]|uniref:DUF6537 domain-containing protein n=1 Tax=Kineobactrum salinum TaxID=2708301 RepID=A0A6C0U3T1_9GAMM|nr:DUF6537 domain-containing protein [Kineobactrum salinum]QIB66503.1 hypothetical protein G3T16_14965 [Kineobactrum salinum]